MSVNRLFVNTRLSMAAVSVPSGSGPSRRRASQRCVGIDLLEVNTRDRLVSVEREYGSRVPTRMPDDCRDRRPGTDQVDPGIDIDTVAVRSVDHVPDAGPK